MSEAAPEHAVELEIRLAAPPEAVFPYLVESERYSMWQGVRADLDARPGGLYRVWMDTGTVARGAYVDVEAPRRVVFTWGWEGNEAVPPGSTRVEITLRADRGGTLLTLRHTGLPNGDEAALHREGWTLFTARLEVLVRREDPDAMPDRSP
jgi:uncharacterized protein YndB with AHSA1/START domain